MSRLFLGVVSLALVTAAACAQPSEREFVLEAAAAAGDSAAVVRLLAEGADPNSSTKKIAGRSALQLALLEEHPAIVRVLLESGADPNDRTGWGDAPPLHSAWDSAMVVALVNAGADVDGRSSRGDTALFGAAKYGHLSVLRELIRLGADPNARNSAGQTPLHETTRADVARLLVAAGADVNATHDYGATPLDVYVSRIRFPRPQLPSDATAEVRRDEKHRIRMERDLVETMRALGARYSSELQGTTGAEEAPRAGGK